MQKKKKKKKKDYFSVAVSFYFLSLMAVILLFVIEMQKEKPDFASFWQNLALSILCSLIASYLFFCFQNIFDSSETEFIRKKLNSIDGNLKLQKSLYDSGIKSIRKKTIFDIDSNFWIDIINSTTNRLDLIGHSISNWFREEYKDTFESKIIEMILSGKKVRIVLSGALQELDVSRIQHAYNVPAAEKGLTKLERTCLYLTKLLAKVPADKQKNLELYVTDLANVTYLYIRTDHQCFISPYILSPSNSQNSFLLELKVDVEYSKSFDNDFRELINKQQCKEWRELLYDVK